MLQIVLLKSAFLSSLSASGDGELATVLGHAPAEYVKMACRGAHWSLSTALEFAAHPTDEVFVVSEAAVGLTEDLLYRFAGSTQDVLEDFQGRVGAVHVVGEAIAALTEDPEADFDTFYQHWLDWKAPGEADPVIDELIMDAPVVDSLLMLQLAEKQVAQQICYDWMEKGVRIDEPTLCRIAPEVTIGGGTHITGSVRILGKSVIGKHCRITDGSEVLSSTLGDGVTVWHSVIESSEMEDASNIGPYSHLRPQAKIGKGVHIGNFVEVKKATLGEGTKAGHLAYIGDATLGADVNVSCGVIFCNYDGKAKHQATIGDHVFLGSNANVVSPVTIADDAFVAAGSTVTKDVTKGALAVERAEQKNIEGYVAKRKAKGTL
ncbi:MAG: DapH/DapD/GlmU-related protein [Peptoniphilaceae bacterium]|nr:DapH/DapD/GlmU-related protein [Peptoniphilaceae bacterium]MDY6085951.1 DapH/DapD/GlmU-related protein [Peptoniphilaceae bacterium]